jgi:hypothetical protein
MSSHSEFVSGPHTFANVWVLDSTHMGWLCEIEHRCIFVDKYQVEPETIIPDAGERGPLTIAALSLVDVLRSLGRARPRV